MIFFVYETGRIGIPWVIQYEIMVDAMYIIYTLTINSLEMDLNE